MTDDEFLNDRDCGGSETPRTDNAECRLLYYETRGGHDCEVRMTYIEPDFARDLERENAKLRGELARAMRVVEAASRLHTATKMNTSTTEADTAFWDAVEEWEAGR